MDPGEVHLSTVIEERENDLLVRHEWERYAVRDGDLLQHLFREHVKNEHGARNVRRNDDRILFSRNDGERWNVYRVHRDGRITSSFTLKDMDLSGDEIYRAVQKHVSFSHPLFDTYVARANKIMELVDYVQEFEAFGVGNTVFHAYCDGSAYLWNGLADRIVMEHGMEKLDEIRAEDWSVFQQAGAVMPATKEAMYDTLVKQVALQEAYDGTFPDAERIDPEVCAPGCDIRDIHSNDAARRKERRRIHYTVLQETAHRLGPAYEDILEDYRFEYGAWSW